MVIEQGLWRNIEEGEESRSSGWRRKKLDLEANMNSPAARQTDMAALLPRPAIDSSRLSM